MDAILDWQRQPVLGRRITGKEIAADKAYIMEKLALAAVYRLIEYEVSREGIITDCDSVRQVINDGHTCQTYTNTDTTNILQTEMVTA